VTIARRNFLDVENRIAEAERSHLPYSIAAQEALRAASAQATVDMIVDLDARRAAEEDWSNGATRAYNSYMETARNVAKKTEDIFTEAYKGIEKAMSDFLFDPFDKGVKGMLQSFGAIVKRMIADAVAADLNKKLIGAVGPAGSGLTGMIGSAANMLGGTGALTSVANVLPGDALDNLFALAGNFKSFDVGTDYVPRDMFAKIHQGEKITASRKWR